MRSISMNFSESFKCRVNEFSLRSKGITNQNTFRYSGRADETTKRGKKIVNVIIYQHLKQQMLDGDSTE